MDEEIDDNNINSNVFEREVVSTPSVAPPGFWSSVGDQVSSKYDTFVKPKVNSVTGAFNNIKSGSSIRLELAKLSSPSPEKVAPTVRWQGDVNHTDDWRVKISVAPKSMLLYNQNNTLLRPLANTDGFIFPITPVITVTHSAKYSSTSPTHSNYASHSFDASEVSEISINGEFPVQNNNEGLYLLAAIYFFRSATKMFWGNDKQEDGGQAGAPPPILFLTGYGSHYFPNVPCVVKSFSHTLNNDVDYVAVNVEPDKVVRLPTVSQIQLILQPVYSRTTVATFSNNDFAKGAMLDKGFI